MADNTAGQTIVASVDQATGQFAAGKITFDATAMTATDYVRVACGFKPRSVKWVNLTDRTTIEWQEGFGSAECLKSVAAGTRTLDTTAAAVVVDDKGFRILQNVALAAVLPSKVCYWEAHG
jgi:hypothetical protein